MPGQSAMNFAYPGDGDPPASERGETTRATVIGTSWRRGRHRAYRPRPDSHWSSRSHAINRGFVINSGPIPSGVGGVTAVGLVTIPMRKSDPDTLNHQSGPGARGKNVDGRPRQTQAPHRCLPPRDGPTPGLSSVPRSLANRRKAGVLSCTQPTGGVRVPSHGQQATVAKHPLALRIWA